MNPRVPILPLGVSERHQQSLAGESQRLANQIAPHHLSLPDTTIILHLAPKIRGTFKDVLPGCKAAPQMRPPAFFDCFKCEPTTENRKGARN
jgi:hypothetical protein